MICHYEVAIKLIGNIMPVGSTEADEVRYKNLKQQTELIDRLVMDLHLLVIQNENAHEASRVKARNHALKFMRDLCDELAEHKEPPNER